MVLKCEIIHNIEANVDSSWFLVGYPVAWDWIADNIKRAQDYLLQNTTLGIPALTQTEGGWPSIPLDMAWDHAYPIFYRYSRIFDRQCHYFQLTHCIWMLLEYGSKKYRIWEKPQSKADNFSS